MLTSPDFKELLNLFKKHEIRYLIVGGYAVMKYSEPRLRRCFQMQKKLTITIDEEFYEGLRTVIGPRKISRFIQELVRPHMACPMRVQEKNCPSGYSQTASGRSLAFRGKSMVKVVPFPGRLVTEMLPPSFSTIPLET